jgi:metallophosphoesterase (TIGR03768 family)
MKSLYEYKKICLVFLMSLLIFSLPRCSGGGNDSQVQGYPIDSDVQKTDQRMLSFSMAFTPDTTRLSQVSQYDVWGYGIWHFGAALPIEPRTDSTTNGIMPNGYVVPTLPPKAKLLTFFTISDIHITDKEAPNQLIYLQQFDPTNSGDNTSIYSPVMIYTTHVLDAAIQTVNALHKNNAFDFGISLGDTCNNTSYNELRWYIDVIDGKVITPSSGDHLGAGNIDYQKSYKAAGLDKSIPWYQALGNHDHFYIGSFPVDADPSLGIRDSYISGTVWSRADFLIPLIPPLSFPVLFNMDNMTVGVQYYQGLIDGLTPLGNIIKAGKVGDPSFDNPPTVVADANRRSLRRTEWISEFFNTSSRPAGHGFNLVNPTQQSGFACYSFLPKSNIPIKVIVLDDTQSETDGSKDIHGHGYLDANRWAWLKAELAAGQAANQLMIIAAHIPIAVVKIGDETEWWLGDRTARPTDSWWADPIATTDNAVTLKELVDTLQNTPNLLMWIAGHRHLNTVKAFISPDPAGAPEKGFWQVETSSLRDWPQQFRTFEIYLNSDYTISIKTINVDPAVKAGTPAATSRKYAIAAYQITQGDARLNNPNPATITAGLPAINLPSMDPSRMAPQSGPQFPPGNPNTDPTIHYGNVGPGPAVPYNASYNATLYKQLSPAMKAYMQVLFP